MFLTSFFLIPGSVGTTGKEDKMEAGWPQYSDCHICGGQGTVISPAEWRYEDWWCLRCGAVGTMWGIRWRELNPKHYLGGGYFEVVATHQKCIALIDPFGEGFIQTFRFSDGQHFRNADPSQLISPNSAWAVNCRVVGIFDSPRSARRALSRW